MQMTLFKATGFFAVAIAALISLSQAVDGGFAVHMAIVGLAAMIAAVVTMRGADFSGREAVVDYSVYDDEPIRWGVIAVVFWGLIGLTAGLYIALQLSFPALNLGLEYTSFGRLRPLHTSAVIFAFGGNALIA